MKVLHFVLDNRVKGKGQSSDFDSLFVVFEVDHKDTLSKNIKSTNTKIKVYYFYLSPNR